MNWTNLQEIEQNIVKKQYTNKEAFYYFLGTAIIYTLSYFLIDQVYKGLFKLIVIPAAVITIKGSIYCFKVYSKNGGTNFFKDYFALSWVINWRLFLFGILFVLSFILFVSIVLSNIDFDPFTPEKIYFNLSMELCFGIPYYILIYRSFKRVSLGKPYKTKG